MIKLIFVVLYIVGAYCSRHTLLFNGNQKLGDAVKKQTIDSNTNRWIRGQSFKACKELANWLKTHKVFWKTYELQDFQRKYPDTVEWITTGADGPQLNQQIEGLVKIDKNGNDQPDTPELTKLKEDIKNNNYRIQVVNGFGAVRVKIVDEGTDAFTIFEASKVYLKNIDSI